MKNSYWKRWNRKQINGKYNEHNVNHSAIIKKDNGFIWISQILLDKTKVFNNIFATRLYVVYHIIHLK